MQWSDRAILLSLTRHGEHAAILRMFTEHHGLCAALAHGAYSRDKRGMYQTGNIIQASWRARASEQLGSIQQAELLTPIPALIMQDAARLQAMASACAVTEYALAERHPETTLFHALLQWLQSLPQENAWQAGYVRFEVGLLAACGYGLDLHSCAVSGAREGLAYVSPKTGRAVTRAGAGPYRDMLLPLPAFLRARTTAANPAQIIAGLELTGHFLLRSLFAPRKHPLPAARRQLLAMMKTSTLTGPLH